jgi:hypothetical protein
MCPVCIATAVLITGKVTSASGAAAIAIRKLGRKTAAGKNPGSTRSMLWEIARSRRDGHNSNQRRDQYANDRDREREDSVA